MMALRSSDPKRRNTAAMCQLKTRRNFDRRDAPKCATYGWDVTQSVRLIRMLGTRFGQIWEQNDWARRSGRSAAG